MSKCKQCEKTFQARRPLQAVCSIQCGIALAQATRTHPTSKGEIAARRAEKRALRRRREALKTRSDHLNELQTVVNRFVRLRGGKECISCGRSTGAKMNAGHYLSRGSHPELRFETGSEDSIPNIYPQCEHCNSWKSGNQVEFRKKLVELYGEEAVLKLETQRPPAKWTIEEIKAMKADYKARIKALNQD